MSYSTTYSETATFTVTHARHMAAKVAADLKRMQRFYGRPSDVDIANYEEEIVELLKAGYLATAAYGFKRGDDFVEPALKYTARDLAGAAANDDDPGRVRPGADVSGATFYSFVTYTDAWDQITTDQREAFKGRMPVSRTTADAPGVSGYLESDRTYSAGGPLARPVQREELPMSDRPQTAELFERAITYPDPDPQARLARLVGLDDQKQRLAKVLGLLVNPAGLTEWARRNHPDSDQVMDLVLRRPPLVVLAGDVGSGKTELAETIGDAVARQEGIDVTLLPLSLSTRGQGRVGEMTRLLSAAFDHTIEAAERLRGAGGKARGAVILLVDEADAITQSREAAQMHHEDRAGVNAFIRGVDRIAAGRLPAAVIMCTNRLGSLDPAVRRRAADVLSFSRPDDEQRRTVLAPRLEALGLKAREIDAVVAASGPGKGEDDGFTYSDIVQRLLPAIVLDAYPAGPVTGARAVEIARAMQATPPFREQRP